MFRAEWSGAKQKSNIVELDGGHAGHPHWQFDALRVHCGRLNDRLQSWRAQQSLVAIENEDPQTDVIQDFVLQPDANLHGPDIGVWSSGDLDWCSIHLPVYATWAKQPWSDGGVADTHARAPENAEEIRNWVTSTIRYIAYEISKFV